MAVSNVDRQRKWYGKHSKKKMKQVADRYKITRDWIRDYKSRVSCERCGYSNFRALDFHHKNPSEKDITIGAAGSNHWSIKRILKEIEKCEVLCSNCHRIEHYRE